MIEEEMSVASKVPGYEIRRWYVQETGNPDQRSLSRRCGRPAAQDRGRGGDRNPYSGRFSEDLSAIVDPSDGLGQVFAARIVKALDGAAAESYGKACVVGAAGEYEHGNAFITARFAHSSFAKPFPGASPPGFPSTGKRACRASSSTFRSPISASSMCGPTMTRDRAFR